MRAVVFSGTTEGRAFSKQLGALGADVLVSVATDLGAEEQGSAPGVTVRAGRLEPEEMTALLQGADLCIDATHPYAVEATKNIRAAAAGRGWNTTACSGPQPAAGGCSGVCRCGGGRPGAGPDGGQCPPHHRGQRAGSLFPHCTGAVLPPGAAHPGGDCGL